MKCTLCESKNGAGFMLPDYLQCSQCGLVWLDSARWPSAAAEENRYREHKNSLEEPSYISYLSAVAEPLRALVPAGAHGLDYGAGPVKGMQFVLPEYLVESFDPYFFPNYDLLNFRYDFVICCEAAEHFFSPHKEFSQMARMLKEGAILLVRSMLLPAPEEFAQWHYRRDPTHVCFFSEKSVRWICSEFGFELLRLESPHWRLRKI